MNHQLPHAWIKYVGISYSLYTNIHFIFEKKSATTGFHKKIIIVLNNLDIFHILSSMTLLPLTVYERLVCKEIYWKVYVSISISSMSAENLWLVSKKFANCLRSLFLAKLHWFIEFGRGHIMPKKSFKRNSMSYIYFTECRAHNQREWFFTTGTSLGDQLD